MSREWHIVWCGWDVEPRGEYWGCGPGTRSPKAVGAKEIRCSWCTSLWFPETWADPWSAEKDRNLGSLFPSSVGLKSLFFVFTKRCVLLWKRSFLLGPVGHPEMRAGALYPVSSLTGNIFSLLMTLLSLLERTLFTRNWGTSICSPNRAVISHKVFLVITHLGWGRACDFWVTGTILNTSPWGHQPCALFANKIITARFPLRDTEILQGTSR